MNIAITVPDAKFSAGDVVLYGHSRGSITLLIAAIGREGEWSLYEGRVYARMHLSRYVCAAQAGADFDDANEKIRPGTVVTYSTSELDASAVKLNWDAEVVACDTKENIGQRKRDWAAAKAASV